MPNFKDLTHSNYNHSSFGAENFQPYLDQDNNPMIGLGMNLRDADVRQAVSKILFNTSSEHDLPYIEQIEEAIAADHNSTASLQLSLNDIMFARAADENIDDDNPRLTFAFQSQEEMKSAFDYVTTYAQEPVNNTWTGQDANAKDVTTLDVSSNNTIYFPSLSGENLINGSHADGSIRIGDADVSGKAYIKFNIDDDSEIPYQWTRNGFEFGRVNHLGKYDVEGNHLVISAADDSKNVTTEDKITIINYPFGENSTAFDIDLDESTPVVPPQYHSIDDSFINSDTQSQAPLFKTADGKNFFCLMNVDNGIAVRTFDEDLNIISTETLHEGFNYDGDLQDYRMNKTPSAQPPAIHQLENGNLLYIYSLRALSATSRPQTFNFGYNKGYLAEIGTDGKVISNRIIDEDIASETSEYWLKAGYRKPEFVNAKGMCFNDFPDGSHCGPLNATSLHSVTEEEYLNYQEEPQDHSEITLDSGSVVSLGTPQDDFEVKIQAPTQTNERVRNYDISSDKTIDASLNKFMVSLKNGHQATLEISDNPDGIGIINGFSRSDSDARLLLPYPLSDAEIYEISSNQYSIEALLNGEFSPSAETRIVSPYEKNTNNAVLHTVSNSAEPALDLESSKLHTLIVLPNNQTIVLDGITSEKFLAESHQYIATHSPSFQPTTRAPSGQPTNQPNGDPSGQPSRQPNGDPSGQPSRQPNGDPSGQPSLEPSRNEQTFEPSPQASSNSEPKASSTNSVIDTVFKVLGSISGALLVGFSAKKIHDSRANHINKNKVIPVDYDAHANIQEIKVRPKENNNEARFEDIDLLWEENENDELLQQTTPVHDPNALQLTRLNREEEQDHQI